ICSTRLMRFPCSATFTTGSWECVFILHLPSGNTLCQLGLPALSARAAVHCALARLSDQSGGCLALHFFAGVARQAPGAGRTSESRSRSSSDTARKTPNSGLAPARISAQKHLD